MKYKAYVAIDALDDTVSLFLFEDTGRYAVISIEDLDKSGDSPDSIKCWCHSIVSMNLLYKPENKIPRRDDMIDPVCVYEFDLENCDD